MDEILKPRFWQKPMFKWRCIVAALTASFFLGAMQVLGFHPPQEPQGTIIFVGLGLLWAICDAVEAILARTQAQSGIDNG